MPLRAIRTNPINATQLPRRPPDVLLVRRSSAPATSKATSGEKTPDRGDPSRLLDRHSEGFPAKRLQQDVLPKERSQQNRQIYEKQGGLAILQNRNSPSSPRIRTSMDAPVTSKRFSSLIHPRRPILNANNRQSRKI